MIAGLRGRLEEKLQDSLLIEANGVIYRVGTSTTTLSEIGDIGDEVRVHTYLYVREDQLALYGFATAEELRLFETLLGVSGVGPRLACAILSRMPVEQFAEAISAENVALLGSVPGVGKKTAARLVLELRGKLTAPAAARTAGAFVGRDDADVVDALRALGFSAVEAHNAVARAPRKEGMTTEERIVAALQELGEGS